MEHDLLSLAEPSDRRTRQIVGLSRLKFNQPVSDHFVSSFLKIFPPCMTKRTLSSSRNVFQRIAGHGNHVWTLDEEKKADQKLTDVAASLNFQAAAAAR